MKPILTVTSVKSKKTGKDINCLKLKFGLYETLLFPTPVELDYISNNIRSKAHSSFAEDDDESEEDSDD